MNRTQLFFRSISEVVGGNGMAVIVLTDKEARRAVSVVCDSAMKWQIGMRHNARNRKETFLPEVMTALLTDVVSLAGYEITVSDIVDGEYQTAIINKDTLVGHKIRLSDAVLLSLVSDIPIYMDNRLMYRQSSPYNAETDRMAIPINTLATDKLKEELDKAIEAENYRLASQIKEELNNREKTL